MLYTGKVILDSDITRQELRAQPRPKGTVLVRIDGVSFTNKTSEVTKFPLGSNVTGSISRENLELLDSTETFAYVMQSVLGGDGQGIYSAKDNTSNVNHGIPGIPGGFPPAAQFDGRQSDLFSGPPDVIGSAAGGATMSKCYRADLRSNQAHGNHGVPRPGTQVVLEYIFGSRALPVVIGVLPGSSATQGILATNSPGVYPTAPNAASDFRYSNESAVTTIND